MLRRKRKVTILSTAAPELEFYSGRRSFLAIEIHVGNSDLGSHLFLLIKKSLIWITNKSKYWKLQLKVLSVVFKKVCWSRLSFKTQFKIEFLLPFFGSRNALKITLFLVPLLVKHNKNLKWEITEHWFVFLYSKCDFWTSHARKCTCTKFQLNGSFRPEVIKESVNSKWHILVQIRYFAQIFK